MLITLNDLFQLGTFLQQIPNPLGLIQPKSGSRNAHPIWLYDFVQYRMVNLIENNINFVQCESFKDPKSRNFVKMCPSKQQIRIIN